ncbi:hypothetical protein D3C75_1113080 [compost metagenome]
MSSGIKSICAHSMGCPCQRAGCTARREAARTSGSARIAVRLCSLSWPLLPATPLGALT